MSGAVYFGTKDKQSWIKSPSSGMRANSVGWASKTQLLNGRSFIRRSGAAHREFSPSWFGELNSATEQSLQEIKNYADGLYGDGPYYFVDPYASSQNVLPPHWAAPMLTEKDWPALAPGLLATFTKDAQPNNFPLKQAEYIAYEGYESTNKLVLIIPPTLKLHFGWHGPDAGAPGVRITPYLRATGLPGNSIDPLCIEVGGTTPTNTVVDGSVYSYVEVFIASDAEQSILITGMIAQLLPANASASTGGFIAGKGITSLEFDNSPDIEYYSSAIGNGQVGMSVNWTEV